ncbi:hypothetical protein HU200_027474 [Digitaria exilis]|uniref:C2 domain-containing protein n=1 Tax=Digitaria exilis TaxID=1010633 RepID=A0A835C5E3_9POAL|nr:hypothetical protein HU200_027474 [Digitaria exilis]
MQLPASIQHPLSSALARSPVRLVAKLVRRCLDREVPGSMTICPSMEGSRGQPGLELSVRIVKAAGLGHLENGGGGALFVRYYVPAGDGRRRLRVDTREVATCDGGDTCHWGEHARFERWGSPASAPAGGAIAFELRWRPRRPLPPSSGLAALLVGRRPSSRVLARGELAWPDQGAAAAVAEERWLVLSPAGSGMMGCKAPRLLVQVDASVRDAGDQVKGVTMRGPGVRSDECCGAGERCGQCGWVGNEEDMFLAATFAHQ